MYKISSGMSMPPQTARADIESSPLYNPDLAPTVQPGEAASGDRGARTWGTYNYAALWVSMSVNILTYMLAASLIQGGMNWKQAVFTVFLGNCIVLAPMLLNSHPGAQYGIPFPVLARASFGVLGANVAAVLACPGGVRMVWHPDLDWRRGHQCSAGYGMAGVESRAARRGHMFYSVLAD